MARSLIRKAGGLVLALLLAGCAATTHKPEQALDQVLQQQRQAEAAYRAGDMPLAVALYQKLVKAVPNQADYWYLLGNAYVRLQEPQQAVQAYQQAILYQPKHARAWHNLGIVRLRQAEAAFVSSAGTADPQDPMHDLSAHLADELAKVGREEGRPPASGAKSAGVAEVEQGRATSIKGSP